MAWTPSLANLLVQTTPPVTRLTDPLNGILSVNVIIYDVSTSTSTVLESLIMSWSSQVLRRCFNILSIDASGILRERRHSYRKFFTDHRFQLDSYSIRPAVFNWIRFCFLFNLTHVSRIYFWFDSHHLSTIAVQIQGVWTAMVLKWCDRIKNKYVKHESNWIKNRI